MPRPEPVLLLAGRSLAGEGGNMQGSGNARGFCLASLPKVPPVFPGGEIILAISLPPLAGRAGVGRAWRAPASSYLPDPGVRAITQAFHHPGVV